jgi:gamma-glutamylcyclotransferase (GGCT)/AIG2-like uncharacterized protein YtfP
MTSPVHYFAYGSNMSRMRLNMRVSSAKPLGIATLQGHRLMFHKIGKDGSAKCDAWRTGELPDVVQGVLFRLESDELTTLDHIEGTGAGYERCSVVVADSSGRTIRAETYLATRIDPALRPYTWYREHVLRGALAAGLRHDYVAAIRAVPAEADPDRQRHAREMAIYQESRISRQPRSSYPSPGS